MPSFDIVSEIDLQELDNAVNQAAKEVETRFDFRGGKSSIELDRKVPHIKIVADDDMKLRSIHQILELKLAKRSIDYPALTTVKRKRLAAPSFDKLSVLKVASTRSRLKKSLS